MMLVLFVVLGSRDHRQGAIPYAIVAVGLPANHANDREWEGYVTLIPAKRLRLIINQGVLEALLVEAVDRLAPRTFAR
jgi:hypothetical protein